jgi:hypothetical protein
MNSMLETAQKPKQHPQRQQIGGASCASPIF